MAAQERQKFYYDRHAKPLKGLKPEEIVRVRENRSWVLTVVTDIWPTPRSYVVKTESGMSLRRSRKHLLKQLESTSLMESDEEGVTSVTEVATPNKCVSPSEEVMVVTSPERLSINTPPERSLYRTRSCQTVKPPDRLNL